MTILLGDCRTILPTLDAGSVRCCVTSPPYWGLRDYGTATWEGGADGCDHNARSGDIRFSHPISDKQKSNAGSAGSAGSECSLCGARRIDSQIGLEKTPEEYVAEIVAVFREVRRVLADDGTLWLNLGDSYTGSGKGGNPEEGKQATNRGSQSVDVLYGKTGETAREAALTNVSRRWTAEQGLAPKNLVGIPWRVAFALQADGWYLRSDIIWHKPNSMPESVTDRPTKAHEYVFLLSKSARYFYDAGAIAEALSDATVERDRYTRVVLSGKYEQRSGGNMTGYSVGRGLTHEQTRKPEGRNARTVWTIPTQPTPDAHFATFPEALAERCILAGSAQGDAILDPFFGSGTVGKVAERLGRKWIGCELNEKYVEIGKKKTAQRGMFV